MRQRSARLATALLRHFCRAALRAAVTGLIFTTCLLASLAYLGVPLPDAYEMLKRVESVSQLAEAILR